MHVHVGRSVAIGAIFEFLWDSIVVNAIGFFALKRSNVFVAAVSRTARCRWKQRKYFKFKLGLHPEPILLYGVIIVIVNRLVIPYPFRVVIEHSKKGFTRKVLSTSLRNNVMEYKDVSKTTSLWNFELYITTLTISIKVHVRQYRITIISIIFDPMWKIIKQNV